MDLEYLQLLEQQSLLVSIQPTLHTMNVFWAVFKLSCWMLFLYQAWRCLEQFLEQTNTRIGKDSQRNIPAPLICLGSEGFINQSGAALVQKSIYDKANYTCFLELI